MLVTNWKRVLLKSWAVWAAAAGLLVPELAQLLATNVANLPLEPATKEWIRIGCLAAVILFRPIGQKSLVPPKEGQ